MVASSRAKADAGDADGRDTPLQQATLLAMPAAAIRTRTNIRLRPAFNVVTSTTVGFSWEETRLSILGPTSGRSIFEVRSSLALGTVDGLRHRVGTAKIQAARSSESSAPKKHRRPLLRP